MRDMGWFAAGYGGLGGFLAVEAAVRAPGSASSLAASGADEGTTRAIVIAGAVSAGLAPLVRLLRLRRMPGAAGPLGVSLQAVGLGLRLWAMMTLRAAYTRTLRTSDDQPTVARGPYAVIRHPGYLGSLLVWVGFALTSRSPAVVVLAGGLIGRAYARRIAVEERLLERDLPGYQDYARRTRRLIPYVW